jgi:alkanesulfonate monooxygenase SsuD/methylene tetrahydromethanopterin reductase-like flavin-dependent oxidoreductase (luciferase family)
MERFNSAKANNPEKTPKIMLLHHAYVAKDAADADQAIQELTKFYCYFGAWFQNKRPVAQGSIQKLTDQDIAEDKMISAEKLARDLTVGTASEVIDRIKRYEDLGYDEFAFWIDSGMSGERKKESLARFINEVMPAFQ